MPRSLVIGITILLALLAIAGAITAGWAVVGLILALAVLVALMSGVRFPIYVAFMLFPLVLIAAQVRTQIEVAGVPAPPWTIAVQRQRSVACTGIFEPVTGKPATAVTGTVLPPIGSERAMFVTDVLLRRVMINLGKQHEWLSASAVGLLTPLRLISAEFPDGKTHMAWYRGVISDGRFPASGVTFAYVDAESGQPLMLATDVIASWDTGFECRTFQVSPQVNDAVTELAQRGLVFYLIGALALNVIWAAVRVYRHRRDEATTEGE